MSGFIKKIRSLFTGFKIPTLVGIGIILIGISAGVVLVMQQQTLLTQASPAQQPINITVGSIEDTSAGISWQTNSDSPGFVTYGPNGGELTALDVHDDITTTPRIDHYVKLAKLTPKTTYQFKIVSGKQVTQVQKFTTATSAFSQNKLPPIIGSVLDSGKLVKEGLVFLTIPGATIQVAPISSLGSFTIPLTKVYKNDLLDILPLSDDTLVTIKIISGANSATATFSLSVAQIPLPAISLGDNTTLTKATPAPMKDPDLVKYDLNDDGQMNSADYSIVLQNFGKSPKNKRADITGPQGTPDGVVDKLDQAAMSQKINERGGSVPSI